jgi:hypothetical protein
MILFLDINQAIYWLKRRPSNPTYLCEKEKRGISFYVLFP